MGLQRDPDFLTCHRCSRMSPHAACMKYARGVFALVMMAGLTGCALADKEQDAQPLDRARIVFSAQPMAELRARRLNGNLVRSLRFPDLPAGSHQLEVRFRYERAGGRGKSMGESQQRVCDFRLSHSDFVAGQTYVIRAERFNWGPRAWLQDNTGKRLVAAEVVRCVVG